MAKEAAGSRNDNKNNGIMERKDSRMRDEGRGLEEGSALGEALEFMKRQRDVAGNNNNGCGIERTCLESMEISIYSLEEQGLRKMSQLCIDMNEYLREKCRKRFAYPWEWGGDGLVLGLDVDKKKKKGVYLKGICRYGSTVMDEWYAISLCFLLSKEFSVCVEVWDVEDGEILLIEGAECLPEWVDAIGPHNCVNRVWIVHGQVHLINPSLSSDGVVSRASALDILAVSISQSQPPTLAPAPLQHAIRARIAPFLKIHNTKTPSIPSHIIHTAPLVLPLSLAKIIHSRPDLVNPAVLTFANQHPIQNNQSSTQTMQYHFENLVFVPVTFSRTTYAMLLHSQPSFQTPKHYHSMEYSRMQRKCNAQSSNHYLHNALNAGVRLTCAFECLYQNSKRKSKNQTKKSAKQLRLEYWNEIYKLSDATVSSSLAKCPLFAPEIQNAYLCPLSHPYQPIYQQLTGAFKEGSELSPSSFPFLCSNDVHSDDWMNLKSVKELDNIMESTCPHHLPAEAKTTQQHKCQLQSFDEVLDGFKSFVQQSSDVQGVQSLPTTTDRDDSGQIPISTYFSDDDDEFSSDARSSDDVQQNDSNVDPMIALMKQMDQELQLTGDVEHTSCYTNNNDPDQDLLYDKAILSNLLASMEAAANEFVDATAATSAVDFGSPSLANPVMNMLQEMGVSVPDARAFMDDSSVEEGEEENSDVKPNW